MPTTFASMTASIIASPSCQGVALPQPTGSPKIDVTWRYCKTGAVVGSVGGADRACCVRLPVRRVGRRNGQGVGGHTKNKSRRFRSIKVRAEEDNSESTDSTKLSPGIDYGEYGRRGKQELKANVISAFPKFVLVSASCIAIAGSLDFYKFAKSMRNGGAEKRWRTLVEGEERQGRAFRRAYCYL